jgi:hypothetical protein
MCEYWSQSIGTDSYQITTGGKMRIKIAFLVLLGIMFAGGLTMSSIENVSAPIRIVDDDPPPPPPKDKSDKLKNSSKMQQSQGAIKNSTKVKALDQKQQIQKTKAIQNKAKAGSATNAMEYK